MRVGVRYLKKYGHPHPSQRRAIYVTGHGASMTHFQLASIGFNISEEDFCAASQFKMILVASKRDKISLRACCRGFLRVLSGRFDSGAATYNIHRSPSKLCQDSFYCPLSMSKSKRAVQGLGLWLFECVLEIMSVSKTLTSWWISLKLHTPHIKASLAQPRTVDQGLRAPAKAFQYSEMFPWKNSRQPRTLDQDVLSS
jgi:hypothetical protein